MKHEDGRSKPHGVHGAIGVSLKVLDDLYHSSRPETMKRLGMGMRISKLRYMQRKAELVDHSPRQAHQVGLRAAEPNQGFEFSWHVQYT